MVDVSVRVVERELEEVIGPRAATSMHHSKARSAFTTHAVPHTRASALSNDRFEFVRRRRAVPRAVGSLPNVDNIAGSVAYIYSILLTALNMMS